MMNMMLVWFLFMFSLMNSVIASLWRDESDLLDDSERLAGGENLVYFTYGDLSYHMNLINNVSKGFNVKHKNVACFVASENNTIIQQIAAVSKSGLNNGEKRIAVISGMESLQPSQMKALDFLFRITDKTVALANIIVLLAFNNEILTLPGVQNERLWRESLANHINSESEYINGAALTGRISRAAIQTDTSNESSSVGLEGLNTETFNNIQDYCTSLGGGTAGVEKDLGEVRMDFTSFLALLSIPLIMYYINKRAQQSIRAQKASEEKQQQQQQQGLEQEHGKPARRLLLSISTDSSNNNSSAGCTPFVRGAGDKNSERDEDEDEELPVMIPASATSPSNNGRSSSSSAASGGGVSGLGASGGSPSVFDNTLFRADYRSNHGVNAVCNPNNRSRNNSACTTGSYNGSESGGPFSASRNSGNPGRSKRVYSTDRVYHVHYSDDEEGGGADGGGNDGDDRSHNSSSASRSPMLSSLKIGRLSYGSAASRSSTDLADQTSSNIATTSVEEAANLIRIDINESIHPVKRRGRKSTSGITKPVNNTSSSTSSATSVVPTSDRVTRSSGRILRSSTGTASATEAANDNDDDEPHEPAVIKTRGRAKSGSKMHHTK